MRECFTQQSYGTQSFCRVPELATAGNQDSWFIRETALILFKM